MLIVTRKFKARIFLKSFFKRSRERISRNQLVLIWESSEIRKVVGAVPSKAVAELLGTGPKLSSNWESNITQHMNNSIRNRFC